MSAEFIEKSTRFLRDVKLELGKVSWPTWTDVRGATIVVIIIVLIIGFFIGLVDFIIVKGQDLLFLG